MTLLQIQMGTASILITLLGIMELLYFMNPKQGEEEKIKWNQKKSYKDY